MVAALAPTRGSPPVLSLADLEAWDPRAPARPEGSRGERRFCCPLPGCAAKPRDAAHRSLSLNAATGAWLCHRCGGRGQLRERWQPRAQRRRALARRALSLVPISVQSAVPRPGPAPRPAPAPAPVAPGWDWRRDLAAGRPLAGTPGERYLAGRGLPVDVAAAAGVVYVPGWCGRPAVVCRLGGRAGELVAATGRYVDGGEHPKTRTGGGKRLGVFATAGAWESARVVVAEAPIDALSLALCGVPAIALCGTTAPDWLAGAVAFRRVALALDADSAGDEAVPLLAARLRSFGARVERWRPLGAKDWNELLQRRGRAALRAVLAGTGEPGAAGADAEEEAELDDDDEVFTSADEPLDADGPAALGAAQARETYADELLRVAEAAGWPRLGAPPLRFVGERDWRAFAGYAGAGELVAMIAELEHALGLRELPETPAEHAARKEAERRERERDRDRHPDWARATGPRGWVQTYKPGEGLPAIGADGGADGGP